MSPNAPLFTGVKDERAAISLAPAGAAPLALHFDVLEPCLPGPGWDPSPMFPIRNLINPLYFLFLSSLNSSRPLTVKTQQEAQISQPSAHSNRHRFVWIGAKAGARKPGL